MNTNFNTFKKKLASPIQFRMFLLSQLPTAFFCGIRLHSLTESSAATTVHYGWFNRNPFRSMYFAVLAMAGEISTGILAMGALYQRNPSVSMLLVKTEGEFFKKAIGKILFTCSNGAEIENAVEQAIKSGAGTICACTTTGVNEHGEIVATFIFTWSFKARKNK